LSARTARRNHGNTAAEAIERNFRPFRTFWPAIKALGVTAILAAIERDAGPPR
jgi:hypothetical protein